MSFKHSTHTCDRCKAEFTSEDGRAMSIALDAYITRKMNLGTKGWPVTWDLCENCIRAFIGWLKRCDPEALS